MNKWLQGCMGLNAAAAIRGFRHGPRELFRRSRAAFAVAAPFEPAVSPELPEPSLISLEDLLGERRATILLPVMRYEDGMQPTADALALLSLLVVEAPSAVLEIGTYMGHTTRAIAENVPAATVHTIDLPPDFSPETDSSSLLPKDDFHLIERRRVGREFNDHPSKSRIVQHFGDSASFDFKVLGNPEFIFIDGSHTYEYCKSDSEKSLAIAAANATFVWHDCDQSHPGVLRFLSEWMALGRQITKIAGTSLAYWKVVGPSANEN